MLVGQLGAREAARRVTDAAIDRLLREVAHRDARPGGVLVAVDRARRSCRVVGRLGDAADGEDLWVVEGSRDGVRPAVRAALGLAP